MPVLLLVAQLDPPPVSWTQVGTAIRRFLPGPATWCTIDALGALPVLKSPEGFPDWHHLSKAIQFRVATMEATAKGGLDVNRRAFRSRNLVNAPMFPGRAGAWADWCNKGFLFQLQSSLRHCTNKEIRVVALENELSHFAVRPYPYSAHKRVRSLLQKTVSLRILPGQLTAIHSHGAQAGKMELGHLPYLSCGSGLESIHNTGQPCPPSC